RGEDPLERASVERAALLWLEAEHVREPALGLAGMFERRIDADARVPSDLEGHGNEASEHALLPGRAGDGDHVLEREAVLGDHGVSGKTTAGAGQLENAMVSGELVKIAE